MRQLILTRTFESDDGTFGHLVSKDGELNLHTAECPWRGNRPFKSCIPEERYFVNRHDSPKFGECCILSTTSPRTNILIHKGNFAGDVDKGLRSDVEGCILVGMGRGELAGPKGPQTVVTQSTLAFNLMMRHLWKESTIPWGLEIIRSQGCRT